MWKRLSAEDGITTYRLDSWPDFYTFIEADTFTTHPRSTFLWRGHRQSGWSLETTFDRLIRAFAQRNIQIDDPVDFAAEHLDAFQHATRGRRGLNPPLLLENDWWALGQHFGLATPLLDWTRSPFAAAYFAYESVSGEQTEFRTIYALNETLVMFKNREIQNGPSIEGRPPIVEIIDPLSDENARLVNQGGVFTRAPIGLTMEDWVSSVFESSNREVLLRIEIPDTERLHCLRALNRMNINHLSLFPDLTGASRFTNLRREIA